MTTPPRNSGARAQSAFRARLRERGLIARQVFIRPGHADLLRRIERCLREPFLPTQLAQLENPHPMADPWTTRSLHGALAASPLRDTGVSIELIEGADPAISATMAEHGDLVIQLAVSGEQIFVSVPLCGADQVRDRARFNDACLRLNPVNPLSNIGLLTIDGNDVYIVFGELSARAPLDNVIEEIMVLADNTLEAAEAFANEIVQ